MLDYDSHNTNDEGLHFSFDFQGFFFKVLNFWKIIIICIGLGLLGAYLISTRKQNIYKLGSLISIENDRSPFSTATTSISFNWGGVSGKVGQVMTSLKTRTHNEKVVDSLKLYIEYLKEGKYQKIDVYKKVPYIFKPNMKAPQLLNQFIGIRLLNETTFELFTEFEQDQGKGQLYGSKDFEAIYNLPVGPYTKTFKFGEPIRLPFLNGVLELNSLDVIKPNVEYFLRFKNFDQVVNSFQKSIKVGPFEKSTSIIELSIIGYNKSKIVDFLNATSTILSHTDLERKNAYATNTINFIDSTLTSVDLSIKDMSQKMDSFRRQNDIIDVEADMEKISTSLQVSQTQQEEIRMKLNYLNSLEVYLKTESDYSGIAAPTSVGIEEGNIITSVSRIITLSTERKTREYTTREESSIFKNIDRQIEAEKNVLMATITSTKSTLRSQLESLLKNITSLEGRLSELPNDQQEFLKIQRQLNISQAAYDQYVARRSEAAIARAANISDITVVDNAKDIGGGLIGPDTSLNYMMGLLAGLFVPLVILFIIYFLDNTIHGAEEVKRLSQIPILGVVGKDKHRNNLVVFEKPKSAVAESFRAIRSSLQFVIKNNNTKHNARTILLTSSIGGEGKTFCSINMATIYAMSGKKTILVGLDLRKPKIFGDFNLSNKKGVVNYLIEERSLEEITNETAIKNFDIITAGPIPPNPSELLISERMNTLINELRAKYEIIILDTPPLGIVTDAQDLTKFADTNIFILRLNYTKKGMLQFINAKYRSREIKNLSFVLNFYKHNTSKKMGNSYGYGYGYGYGVYGNSYHEQGEKLGFIKKMKQLFKKKS
ncbi:GumC family protein [Algibacter mikhailovii]|uniref:non-specific protein-tyrosine kinase n=1 Tax=Algibacter mikhailovii TaxID=425498 RepID=A0A918R0A8_9FLAO|nr:tyrosine-protein kinase [Algibacter mikhailovii]GGZ81103.1 sugar transporter [Algibacter mikhailovii]